MNFERPNYNNRDLNSSRKLNSFTNAGNSNEVSGSATTSYSEMFLRKKDKIPSQRSLSKEKKNIENRNQRSLGATMPTNQRSIPVPSINYNNSNDYTTCSYGSFNNTNPNNYNNVLMPPAYPQTSKNSNKPAVSTFHNYNRNNTSSNKNKSGQNSNSNSIDLINLSQDKTLSPKSNFKFSNNLLNRCKSTERLQTVNKEEARKIKNINNIKSLNNINSLNRDSSRNNSMEKKKNESFSTLDSQNFTSVDLYLQRRHTEAQEKLQRLKLEKMNKEEAELRDRPKISKNSQKIVENLVKSNGNVFERLTSGSHSRKKTESMNKIEEINCKNFDKPKINPTSEKLQRTIDDLYYWQRDLNTKNEEAKQKQSQVLHCGSFY